MVHLPGLYARHQHPKGAELCCVHHGSIAVLQLGFASCKARSSFLTKLPVKALHSKGRGRGRAYSQPSWESYGVATSCACCSVITAWLCQWSLGLIRNFLLQPLWREVPGRNANQFCLLKKKKQKTKLGLCQNKTVPVWTCWLCCWLPWSSWADSGRSVPWGLLRIYVLDRRRSGGCASWALAW